MPKLNERVRKKLADHLDAGEQIVATVLLNNSIGTGSVSGSDGGVRQAGSALGTPYAVRLGIDLNDPRLRAQLLASWCTLTDRRFLFHKPKATSIRPTPGDLIEAHPRDGVRVAWFDADGLGMSNRVFHLDFPDQTRVLSATMLKAQLRRKPFNDEPFLFVDGLGAHATPVDNA